MTSLPSSRLLIAFAATCLFLSAAICWNGYSQEAAPAAPKAARAKPRGRLPAYFGDVVNQEQRDKIYQIQATYEEQLALLRTQLKAVVAKRDAEIHGVLTAEQREQVERLAADAKAEREAALKLKTETEDAAPAEPSPAP